MFPFQYDYKGYYGGPFCQDTKIGFNKSYFPPFNSYVFKVVRSNFVEIYFGWRLVIKCSMQTFLMIKGAHSELTLDVLLVARGNHEERLPQT